MTIPEDIIAEAVRLLLHGGAPLWVIVAMVLAAAALFVLGGRIKARPEQPPAPPAEWNTDPKEGAVVVPGPPGGTDDPVQSG